MADNIKIVGEIVNTQQVSRYDENDLNLLSPQILQEDFGKQNDYIEYYIYDVGGNLLSSNLTYKDFKLPTDSYINPNDGSLPIIEIDPVKDLQNAQFVSGEFVTQYNFFNNKISNSQEAGLFIKEISADRTELRLGSTVLTNEQIENGALSLIDQYVSSSYFVNYLANFGNNSQAVIVNTALNKVESGYEILIKLYQPLSENINVKATLWVVEEKTNPYSFDINLDRIVLPLPPPTLRGPNFDIDIPNQNNIATSYQTYGSLINSVQNVSTSSYQQLLSLITSQSIDINIDYSNFENFTFFSSAKQRVINFYDKVKEIENYKTLISTYTPNVATTSSLQNSINNASASINNIIAGFDGFEYYLYFESGSTLISSIEYDITPYPKTGSIILPYTLYPTNSDSASAWFNWATGSAEKWDDYNQNKLTNTVPAFIKDDGNNEPYLNFLDMIGHYFDNIWIFLQSVTDINLANNNLEKGISKDLVYYVLESLGTKLYNQYGDSDNVNYLVGNSGSANWDNNFTYTGSYLNTVPRKDLVAESYKRIYHNLPLLLKTRGTAYGLQTLVSTFGITGSVLQVKEYGGDLKNNTLDEFNNDKVRVVSSSIVSGSVLSPFVSVVEYPTASNQFRTADLHYVDVSFSPQDKIDIFTSASIASTNPGWRLDDFIGDPRLQYSGSYTTLEVERNKYLSPLSASLIPYTSSVSEDGIAATDYNSFIRLIQFFDNSLFKMLKDYIPARTSLSTGITISSPILERNKWVFANPSSTTNEEVKDGTISAPTIGTEYTDIYEYLTGSKVAYYDGNLGGDAINVYSYFASGNFNPYLQPTSSLTSASINEFNHSDYNVMLNNVSSSVTSRNRQDIQYIPGTTQSILSVAELQDSYETLKTHQLSRYEGVKIFSAKYNDYTDGDVSFGKTAVIDKNVVKLGLFSEVVPNKFLPKRNNAVLKYLVDIDGGLTELNLRNTHWEEVQNTFIAGDTASISQFNNQLYSNQKTTDGEKLVFNSGYVYSPILYFSSCSVGGDQTISFQNQGNSSAYLATAQNVSSSYFINGSTTLGYPLQGGYVLNIFNSPIQTGNYWTGSTLSSPVTYSVQETGQYRIYANLAITTEMASGNNVTWSLEMYSGSTKIQESSQSVYFGNLTQSCTEIIITNNGTDNLVVSYTDCTTGAPRQAAVKPGNIRNICTRFGAEEITGEENYTLNTSTPGLCSTFEISGSTIQTTTLTIDNGFSNSNYSNFSQNDKISFKLRLANSSSANFTSSLATGNNGFLSIGSLALSTGYSTVSCSFIDNAVDSSITLTNRVSSFYGNNYLFSPNPTSGSINSLYDEYEDVDYTFNPKPYDMLLLYLSDGTILEYTVLDVILDNGKLTLNLDAPLSNLAISDLNDDNFKRFLLLSRIKDETNVILNFIKRDGKTSYGFLIADNTSTSVLSNIDTITREVKQKILNDQSVINDISGGGF